MKIRQYVLMSFVLFSFSSVHSTELMLNKSWQSIQADAQNAVVQIFVVSRNFNWFNPYVMHGPKQSCGTGFFINKDGEIATCSHVIEDALSVFIGIPCLGKKLLKADVVGLCPSRDIAILRLDDESFECVKKELGEIHCLELGDSHTVQRGEEIICLGYPATTIEIEQLKGTVGVISSRLNRVFQYDAPSNPGNSGGPVLNKKGIVIGITSSGMLGNVQNANFATPINIFKALLPNLYENTLLRINNLGIIWSPTTKDIRAYLGNPNVEGCIVCDLEKSEKVSSLGIQVGDIIYEVDGYAIDSYGDIKALCDGERIRFDEYIGQLPLGSEVFFKVYRNGESLNICAIIDNQGESSIPLCYPSYEEIEYEIFGGMIVMPLTINYIEASAKERPGLQRYLTNLYNQGPRLVIANIIADSKMAHMRTMSWADTINEINGEKVCTLDDFRRALKKSISTGVVVIKTTREATLETDNVLNVLSLYDSCKETVQLSYTHQYPLSKTVMEIIKAIDSSLLKR